MNKNIIGKKVIIEASYNVCDMNRLQINGMCLNIIGIDKENVLAKPDVEEYKNKLIILPLDQKDIFWEIEEVLD